MDTEQIKQMATDVNNVAEASFQSGKEHIERPLLAKIKKLESAAEQAIVALCNNCSGGPIAKCHLDTKTTCHKGKASIALTNAINRK